MRHFVSVCRYTGKAAAPFRIGSAKKTSEDFVKTQSGLIFSYLVTKYLSTIVLGVFVGL